MEPFVVRTSCPDEYRKLDRLNMPPHLLEVFEKFETTETTLFRFRSVPGDYVQQLLGP